jgi:uncharacterized protein (TIGR03435 family)
MIPAYLSPLANHLWQSTLFAVLAGLLTLAFRRNRAPVRYSLWLAASLKFLVPFSLLVGIGAQLDWRTEPAATPAPVTFVAHRIGQPFAPSVTQPVLSAVPPPPSRVPSLLFGVWLLGFLTVTLSWFNRWRRIRTVLRSASPLPMDLPIPVMGSSARLEPGVFGILRPVLLLPEKLADHLTPAQLDAVLAHELCHVRRRDNLAAAIHMFVEALFWFHPLVWWIETRMMEERERACDEEVLRAARDPEVYAEGLLNVCKLYLESPMPCMSGVTGADLKKRIETIMTHRVTHSLTFGKKLLLAAAGMAAVATPIIIGALDLPVGRAQSQPAKPIRAEVVSVKRNTSEHPRSFGNIHGEPGGRLIVRGAPLYFVIAMAYHIPIQSPRLTGGPEWIRSERYDIEALAENGAIPEGLPAAERDARFGLMAQAILADRFKLIMRHDSKEIPVYTLGVGKNGPTLQKSKIEEKDCAEPDPASTGNLTPYQPHPCHTFQGGRGRGIHAKAVTNQETVEFVENWSDRPIINKTGLQGLYDIQTEGWLPFGVRPPAESPAPGTTPTAETLALSDPSTPTLFQIFERLGLKLEPQKAPVEMLIIDRIERPTEN